VSISASRAFELLTEVVRRDRSAGLIELATATDMDKSTASRLLKFLCEQELLGRDSDTRRYQPGPALLLLAAQTLQTSTLRANAHAHLERLRDLSGETATLHLRVGEQRVCIDGAESTQPVRRVVPLGEVTPMHAAKGVTGQVVLAFLPPGDLDRALHRAATEGADPVRLSRRLANIRRKGYWVGVGEKAVGIAAVSAPVRGAGSSLAAVTVSGSDHRWTRARMEAFAPTVVHAASEMAVAFAN
jgi:DNA-binding IclR family transcriptional regulator